MKGDVAKTSVANGQSMISTDPSSIKIYLIVLNIAQFMFHLLVFYEPDSAV